MVIDILTSSLISALGILIVPARHGYPKTLESDYVLHIYNDNWGFLFVCFVLLKSSLPQIPVRNQQKRQIKINSAPGTVYLYSSNDVFVILNTASKAT